MGAGPSAAAAATAYGDAFRWVLGAGLLMAIPAVFLARAESRLTAGSVRAGQDGEPGGQAGGAAPAQPKDPAVGDPAATRS